MADAKISALTELTQGTVADTDETVIVDKSDTTDAASGTTKRYTWSSLKQDILAYIDDATATLTNKTINFANNTVSMTKAQLDTAVSDGNVLYVGDVTSNATHTGEVTGATSLTVDKTAITNRSQVTAASTDKVLISDASDSDNLKYVTAQSIADLATGGGGVSDGDKGDITVSSSGTVWTIDNDSVTYAKMQNVSATNRILGRITSGAGDTEELTGTQATTLLDTFTASLKGLAPASGGGNSTYLRADGTWATPSGSGDVSKVGTPVDNQVAVWTGAGTIEGDTSLTFDTTTDRLSVTTSGIFETGTVELGHASDTTLSRVSAGVIAVEGVTVPLNSITSTHTAQQIELGDAADTTLTRSSAGVLAVEGVTVSMNATTATHTAQQIELGHASDTTITRSGAGSIAVEGVTVPLNSVTDTHTAQQLEIGHASDTTLTRVSAGVAAIEGKNIALNGTGETLTTGTIELGAATDTTISRASAGVAAIEGNEIVVANRTATRTMVLTGAGGWPSTTAGAASNVKVEYVTNDQDLYHLDFDATTDENAQWTVIMPDSYSGGTITAQFYWTANSTSTNSVVWGIQGRAYADGDAIDQAWGSAQTVTDANGSTANTVRISSATSAVTLAGSPAGGQLVQFRVYRDADNGSDNLAVDARLIAVKVEYPINSYTD